MFHLQANKIYLEVCAKEGVTSGPVNVYTVRFSFNSDWDGLDRTAVFHAGDDQISVVLDDSNECQIPWEVLENPGRNLSVGVYGTKGGTVVLPTIWAQLGEIREGVSLGSNAQPPTPDVYSQILEAAEQAEKIAQSVRDDADAGKFDGEPGPEGPQGPPGDGVPEITPEDEGKFLGVLDGAAEWVLGGSGGVADHRLLANRDAADQHPMEAITDLKKEISRIPPPTEAITNSEIEEMLK